MTKNTHHPANVVGQTPAPFTFKNAPPVSGFPLDTLAQLTPSAVGAGFSTQPTAEGSCANVEDSKNRLKRRARSKHFTNKIALPLADLKTDLEKYYRNAYYCNNDLVQIGQKITGKYCNSRLCNNCNRIRTAKMINGYQIELEKLEDKQFITLSAPNISAPQIRGELNRLYSCWRVIMRRFAKSGAKYGGIRKLEITYNPDRDNKRLKNTAYHPHFHIIINGIDNARRMLSYWMELNPFSDMQGQDIKPVTDWALLELFKYSTKVVHKLKHDNEIKIFIKPLNYIFQSLYKKRIIQNFGLIKKTISEDIDELQSQIYESVPFYEFMDWKWYKTDWLNYTGECLSGYNPKEYDLIKIYK